MSDFERFIVENEGADTARLVMSCRAWPVPGDPVLEGLDAKSLAVNTIEARRKLRKKIPEWAAETGLVYPTTLCAEQCSSSDTARYKASIARRVIYEYAGAGASTGSATEAGPTDRDRADSATGAGSTDRNRADSATGMESAVRDGAGSETDEKENCSADARATVTELVEVTSEDGASTGSATREVNAKAAEKRGRIADLTGGLGVDAWAFSEVAEQVLYNEMNPGLAAAARHNFKVLGANNIIVKNFEATPATIVDILSGFRPDIIFLDPARRDSAGKKVFLLEDCSPDVLKMLPELFEISRFVLLKISPMADITMAVERLDRTYEAYLENTSGDGWNGQWVREIHIVASGGECKELLILLDREWTGGYSLICREDGKTLTFKQEEITNVKAAYPDSTFARIIFEPGKSLTKAGVFNALCERFGLTKLARFTHLYTISDPLSDRELQEIIKNLKDFGKIYPVKEILPLNKATMKDVGKRYPHSEVTAKNIPMTSDELRKRLKVSSGDDAHIFGARIETPYNEGNYLIVTKINP